MTTAPEPLSVTVKLPEFKGYEEHIVRELQAAFRLACEQAGLIVVN